MKPTLLLFALALVSVVGLSLRASDAACTAGTQCSDCARSAAVAPTTAADAARQWRDTWGIEVSSVRMSAHGYMVDFRYRVVDPVKAAALSDRSLKPYLVDQSTGAKLTVQNTPKVGPMRQSAVKVAPGRVCATLFSNGRQLVKPGSKVTAVFGDCRMENLAVE